MIYAIIAVVSLALGGGVSYFVTKQLIEKKLGNAKNIAEKADVFSSAFSFLWRYYEKAYN